MSSPRNAGRSAERLASAAVFSDGDVSAWRVPKYAMTDWRRVITALNESGDCGYIADLGLSTEPRI